MADKNQARGSMVRLTQNKKAAVGVTRPKSLLRRLPVKTPKACNRTFCGVGKENQEEGRKKRAASKGKPRKK